MSEIGGGKKKVRKSEGERVGKGNGLAQRRRGAEIEAQSSKLKATTGRNAWVDDSLREG